LFATRYDLGSQTLCNCDNIQPDTPSVQPLRIAAQTSNKSSFCADLLPQFSWTLVLKRMRYMLI